MDTQFIGNITPRTGSLTVETAELAAVTVNMKQGW